MKFVVPENVGGSDLRILPEDTYEAQITDVFLGESQTGKPKATLKFTILSEYTGTKDKDFESCVGATVIETVSLQPQAMWKMNDYYKGATGERIPEGEFEDAEFLTMLKEALIDAKFNILLETDSSQGDERTKIKKATAVKGKKSAKKVVRR